MIDFSHANLFIFCSGVCSHLKNTTLRIELCSKLSKLPTLEFHGRVVTAMEIHSHDLCYTFGKRTYEIEFYFYLFLNNTIGRNVMDTQILFFRQTSNKSTENIFCGTNAIRDTKLPKSGESAQLILRKRQKNYYEDSLAHSQAGSQAYRCLGWRDREEIV